MNLTIMTSVDIGREAFAVENKIAYFGSYNERLTFVLENNESQNS